MAKIVLTLFAVFSIFLGHAKLNFIEVKAFNTWEQVLELAKANNKNLFVYIEAYPCPECKKLKKGAFKDKKISKLVSQDYIALLVPNFSEVGKGLVEVYGITEAPQILVLSRQEDVFYKHSGNIEPTKLAAELQLAQTRLIKYPAWKKALAKREISKLDWIDFLLVEWQNGRVEPGNWQIRKAGGRLDSTDFNLPTVHQFISNLAIDTDGPIFQTLASHPEWIKESEYFKWEDYFSTAYNYNLSKAIVRKDSILLEDVLFQLAKMPEEQVKANLFLRGRQFFLAEQNKWKSYDTITLVYLHAFPPDSSNHYQKEALFLMENYPKSTPKKLALKYLANGLEKKETFELYYTLGLYIYNEGDLENAYKAFYNAYSMAKKSEDKKMAAELLRIIDSYY